ncbi:hypothetical protein [Halorientalis marina]|jgi:hypothetical protein|uniref:hypothetical protein n=1 Tax=Halorientalis marina TaxID=2931976 RepID=UPI001FF471EB|nr:hypothetical protein [Halorientalis marina]
MGGTDTATVEPETAYRRSYVAAWGVGSAAFVGLIAAGLPLVGSVAFGAAVVVGVGAHQVFEGELFDDATSDLRAASTNTIAVLGITAAVVFPTLTILYSLGLYEWPAWLTRMAWFVGALFVVWITMLLVARR